MPKIPPIRTITLQDRPAALRPPSVGSPVRSRRKARARVGAVVGLLAFIAVALFPALVFGSTAGAQLGLGLLGGGGSAPAGVAAFVGAGVVTSLIGGAALFAAAGAALAVAIDALTVASRERQ
jgi:hypothetical protein